MALNWCMSFTKILVLTTDSKVAPAAISMASRFFITRRVSSSILPLTKLPVLGSIGVWPEIYRVLPLKTAWLYGPIGAGALGVVIIFFIEFFFNKVKVILCFTL